MRIRTRKPPCSRGERLVCRSSLRSQRARVPVIGPRPPAPSPGNHFGEYESAVDESGKPRWLRNLEEDSKVDEDIRKVLDGTQGDPKKVEAKIDEYLASDAYNPHNDIFPRLGRDETTRVVFRAYDPSNAWVTFGTHVQFWLEMYSEPTSKQIELLTQLISGWFLTGKMGGYNALNLQVHEAADTELSFMPYEQKLDNESIVTAFYHDLGEVEKRGNWLRFQADLGTGDEIGLDILINTIRGFSRECLGIKQICIGGVNADWPTPEGEQEEMGMSPVTTDTEVDPAEVWTGEDGDIQTYVEQLRERDPSAYENMLEQSMQYDSPHERAEAMREAALDAAAREADDEF